MLLMIAAYGAETGNMGLSLMPYGGLYIAGGIVTKVLHHITAKDSEFMKSFRDKVFLHNHFLKGEKAYGTSLH